MAELAASKSLEQFTKDHLEACSKDGNHSNWIIRTSLTQEQLTTWLKDLIANNHYLNKKNNLEFVLEKLSSNKPFKTRTGKLLKIPTLAEDDENTTYYYFNMKETVNWKIYRYRKLWYEKEAPEDFRFGSKGTDIWPSQFFYQSLKKGETSKREIHRNEVEAEAKAERKNDLSHDEDDNGEQDGEAAVQKKIKRQRDQEKFLSEITENHLKALSELLKKEFKDSRDALVMASKQERETLFTDFQESVTKFKTDFSGLIAQFQQEQQAFLTSFKEEREALITNFQGSLTTSFIEKLNNSFSTFTEDFASKNTNRMLQVQEVQREDSHSQLDPSGKAIKKDLPKHFTSRTLDSYVTHLELYYKSGCPWNESAADTKHDKFWREVSDLTLYTVSGAIMTYNCPIASAIDFFLLKLYAAKNTRRVDLAKQIKGLVNDKEDMLIQIVKKMAQNPSTHSNETVDNEDGFMEHVEKVKQWFKM